MCVCVCLCKAPEQAVQGLPLSPGVRSHIREVLPRASPPSVQSHSPFCCPQHVTTFVEENLPMLAPAPMPVISKLPKPGAAYII